jgi:hypothetical protein
MTTSICDLLCSLWSVRQIRTDLSAFVQYADLDLLIVN